MFFISRDKPMTTDILGKILNAFQVQSHQLFKYQDYYDGKQAITYKQPIDTGRECNRITTNYCYNITQNYLGYIAGKEIKYTHDSDINPILDILNYNDVANEDTSLLKNALIYGRSFEIYYVDKDGKQRFKVLDSRQCIPVYSDDLEEDLMYVIRFWVMPDVDKDTPQYWVEVYDSQFITTYKSVPGFTSFQMINQKPHFYNQVPITVFSLNDEEESIFAQIMTLQDAYNEVVSCEVDDVDAFANAYLTFKGIYLPDDPTERATALTAMKESRAFELGENGEVSYLTKQVNDTQLENILRRINDNIHKISNSPDFTDEKFLSQSGVAIRYKLIGFENRAADIEAKMRMALQRRIELLSEIISLTDGGESIWRDINIIFTRNLPVQTEEIAATVNTLRGLVSDETLLGQIPFVSNVEDEMKRIAAEKEANMSMYNFTSLDKEETEDVK